MEHYSENGSAVYYTKDITPEALVAIYEALNWEPEGKVGIKISTGEPPASHYLDPNLMKDLVQMVSGTIVECNTAYGGSRSGTAMHYQVAKDHGYTDIADVDILDEEGSMTLSVNGGQRLSENYVGSHFADYGSYIVLSHFKGHAMAGFGGAIKNISIGFGSGESGKSNIHTGGKGGSMWSADQDSFLEAMADAGKSVSDYLGNGDRIIYISVMNNLSVDCDCDGHASDPDMHDIGIPASTDPVALDQACVDLVLIKREFIYIWYYFTVQLQQIFRYWVIGILVGSLISVFFKDAIHNAFRSLSNKKLGIVGIPIASALGIASPLCMYGTIPIAASFSKSGMKDDWLAAFMITGPSTKITNLGALKIVLGIKKFIIYLVFVMAFSLITGLMVNMILK